jgi:hypothetical protein
MTTTTPTASATTVKKVTEITIPSTDALAQQYAQQGYCLVRNALPVASIDRLMGNYLDLVQAITGRRFADPHGEEIVAFYNERPDLESEVYLRIRDTPWLTEFSAQPALTAPVRALLPGGFSLFSKIPFRIDMPLWTKELALWHQDHFYVGGNTDVVTAWIPFQDTNYFNGCLTVMPGSHTLGVVPHDTKVGKKSVPSTIFDREVRMVEMRKGDVLYFNALLFHSGNLNVSPSIRYSLQPRFTPKGKPTNPAMGDLIDI